MLVESTRGVVLCPTEALGTRQSEGCIISLAAWTVWMYQGEATVPL